MNIGPFLYDLSICNKKKVSIVVICIWWYSGRAEGIVYPDVLATKWDEVVRSLFQIFVLPILAQKDCHFSQY